jgi:hypothetical protein
MTTVIGDGTLHYYKGGEWRALLDRPAATGGDVTLIEDGGVEYWAHVFRTSDDFVTPVALDVEWLVVGGGGAGARVSASNGSGGGGGAGGLLTNVGSPATISAGTVVVTVGAGGARPLVGDNTNDGNLSAFGTHAVAFGGGGGGTRSLGGRAGGSGGGGSGWTVVTSGGSGTSGQGNNGGAGSDITGRPAGGGGGAGSPGLNGDLPGDGGDGVLVNIDGNPRYFAGGGGGASISTSASPGEGGLGGGGDGSQVTNGENGVPGTDGLGGGGGGGGGSNALFYPSGAGGDGIVIVRYPVRS